MKGKIIKKDKEFLVEYLNTYGIMRTVPVYKPKADLVEDTQVEFEIVDEFSHPKLFADVALFEGMPSARIINCLLTD
jgi:hypothetical protein